MRGGFVSLFIFLPLPPFSLSLPSRPYNPSSLLSSIPIPIPSLQHRAASVSLASTSLSLARLIDPDPVLFSSLFDSRAGLYHRLAPASRRQGLPEGAEARGARDIEVNGERRGDGGGQVRRTGPAIYIFISSSCRAIGDRGRTKEKRETSCRGGVRKNFRPFPPRSASGSPLVSIRAEFATFA